MAWVEQQTLRGRGSKTWRDDATGLFHTHASIARLHYETALDSGIYDGEIAALPTRINNAQLDGWLVRKMDGIMHSVFPEVACWRGWMV